jgi:ribonuclease-3
MLRHPERFNSKSKLQEYSQGLGHGLPVYATEQISQDHGDPRRFRSRVSVAGETSAEGFGKSRKEAEQHAAREALTLIRHQNSTASSTSSDVPQ